MKETSTTRTWAVVVAIVAMLASVLGYAGAATAQGDELTVTKFKVKYSDYMAVVMDGTPVGTSPLGNTHMIFGGADRSTDFGGGGAFIENFDCADGQDPFAPPGSPEACAAVGVIDAGGPNVRLRVATDLRIARIVGLGEVMVDETGTAGDTIAFDLTLTPMGEPIKQRGKVTNIQGDLVDIDIWRGTIREAMVSGTIGDIELEGEGRFGIDRVTQKTNRPDEGPPPGAQDVGGLGYSDYSVQDLFN